MLPAKFHAASCDRKLAPVELVDVGGDRPRPTPQGPFCSSTYASIHGTCSDHCPVKRAGCYVDSGFTKFANDKLDQAVLNKSALDVARIEAGLIDKAFQLTLKRTRIGLRPVGGVPQDGGRGGRELRLHVGGDCRDTASALELAGAAHRWRRRGGGVVWTYTHSWREIPRSAWGKIKVLASVEHPEEVAQARAQSYAPAVSLPVFPNGKRAFDFGGAKIVPCPAESIGGKTCIQGCRLCLDAPLFANGQGIGFEWHGPQAEEATRATSLTTLRVRSAA